MPDDTEQQIRTTQEQLQGDRQQLQSLWAGLDQTHDCLARGAIACKSSRELLRKLSDPK
jgi:hypothetical protein